MIWLAAILAMWFSAIGALALARHAVVGSLVCVIGGAFFWGEVIYSAITTAHSELLHNSLAVGAIFAAITPVLLFVSAVAARLLGDAREDGQS